MQQYVDIANEVLDTGVKKSNRTGIECLSTAGLTFKHDMNDGFPIITTKYIPFSVVAGELEFFIKGLTDKKWLHERNIHIWDEWCSPDKVPYDHDPITKQQMCNEDDLGPIYGWQWRHFGGRYDKNRPEWAGIDQFVKLVKTLKTDKNDRRMIVSAWNPVDLDKMALPPCHYSFQVVVNGNELSLIWIQRSVDVALGLPFNITSYALLLHLLCLECGYKPGKLIGQFGDIHIYTNHIAKLKQQINRNIRKLPTIETPNFIDIFNWSFTDTYLMNYTHHPAIKFDIAV